MGAVSPRRPRPHLDQTTRTTAATTATARIVGTGPSSARNRSFSPIYTSELVVSA